MSDKASLTHRSENENSSSKEKSLKEEVNLSLYNYNIYLSLIIRQIIVSKIKKAIKYLIKYQTPTHIIIE
jgi:hypothetical protein